jgi:hypothetical protein
MENLIYIPTPGELSSALAYSGLNSNEKEKILRHLKYLNRFKLAKLYEYLLEIRDMAEITSRQIEKIDLKYKIEFENSMQQGTA